jgi:hypothetical protein
MSMALAQTPRNFVAIHVREANVEQHDVWLLSRARFECFDRAIDRMSFVAVEFQKLGEAVRRIDIIIDHQNSPRCHGRHGLRTFSRRLAGIDSRAPCAKIRHDGLRRLTKVSNN